MIGTNWGTRCGKKASPQCGPAIAMWWATRASGIAWTRTTGLDPAARPGVRLRSLVVTRLARGDGAAVSCNESKGQLREGAGFSVSRSQPTARLSEATR